MLNGSGWWAPSKPSCTPAAGAGGHRGVHEMLQRVDATPRRAAGKSPRTSHIISAGFSRMEIPATWHGHSTAVEPHRVTDPSRSPKRCSINNHYINGKSGKALWLEPPRTTEIHPRLRTQHTNGCRVVLSGNNTLLIPVGCLVNQRGKARGPPHERCFLTGVLDTWLRQDTAVQRLL